MGFLLSQMFADKIAPRECRSGDNAAEGLKRLYPDVPSVYRNTD